MTYEQFVDLMNQPGVLALLFVVAFAISWMVHSWLNS